MGSGSSSQTTEEESATAIALAVIISIIIIIVIAITIFVLFFTDKIPFLERYDILYKGPSPWKHVNRYGDTNLRFVSYYLKDVRDKRRFPPPSRRPENYYDSQSFGTEDNYSINAHSYINNTNERSIYHDGEGPLIINSDDTILSPRSELLSERRSPQNERKRKKKKRRRRSPEKDAAASAMDNEYERPVVRAESEA